jgi:hypothetical protein
MISEQEAKEKVANGWLQVWMVFEVLGSSEKTVKEILEEHVKKFEDDKRVLLYKKEFSDIQEMETPHPNLKKGFSQLCEVEFVVASFEELIDLVMFYGPSACEIIKPEKIELSLAQAQNILNKLGGLMHRLSEAVGGIVVRKE